MNSSSTSSSTIKNLIEKKNVESSILSAHKNIKRKQNMCNVCNKLINASYFRVHMLRHAKTKNYLCTHCGKAFVQASDLQRHLQLHLKQDNLENETVDCVICNKSISKKNIKQHQKRHVSIKNVRCEMCDNKYMSKRELNSHVKLVHLGAYRTKCNICRKIFVNKTTYKSHLLSHSSETWFECDFCGKKFKRRSYMVEHIRSHMGNRLYKCKFCPKAFNVSSSLSTHIAQHSEETPFDCELCTKKFKCHRNLWCHLKRFHKQT